MTELVAVPAAPVVPPFPALGDPAFNQKAYDWGVALPGVSGEVQDIAVTAHTNATVAKEQALASASSASAAAGSATLATTNGAAQVTLAAGQVTLATAQADLAMGYRNTAGTHATTATDKAALASAASDAAALSKAAAQGSAATAALDAQRAEDAAAGIADGPVTSVNGLTGIVKLALTDLQGATTIYVSQSIDYTITNFDSFSVYAVGASAGSAGIVGATVTFVAPAVPGPVTLTITKDGVARAIALTVLAAGVATPTNTSPSAGATNIGAAPVLTSGAFATYGLPDTHASSRWTVYQAGAQVHSSGWTAGALTSYTVPAGVVATSTTYTWTVEHRGAALGDSLPSSPTQFYTSASFGGNIGAAGEQGFGVGEYPGATLPTGFSAMTGTADKASANYGNYQYSDGSVMVFVPKFYYRIGSASSPRYATYGANSIDIAGATAYADETAANAAGFALHRAFKDGGAVKSGFFIDKYLASKNGTASCKSVQNGNPISLTTNASYNPSSGMTGCTGILADAVVLARSRGAGVFNVASIFMYDALAKLSLAHGQAATGTAQCAWYDAAGTTNFPKGCNNGSLADTNDATVTFTTSGGSSTAKPLTGSASNLAKTTHNGQSCGVTDVNGSMYQAMLGLTMAGTSATDTAANGAGNSYALKTSVALASLTGGFGGATDAWGSAANLAANYDLINGFLPWAATTGWDYFGNGASQVFSGATSGTDYLRSCCGIAALTGMSATGTSQFGSDGNYRSGPANLFPRASGYWVGAGNAGVFFRNWVVSRSTDNDNIGFRACAFGN